MCSSDLRARESTVKTPQHKVTKYLLLYSFENFTTDNPTQTTFFFFVKNPVYVNLLVALHQDRRLAGRWHGIGFAPLHYGLSHQRVSMGGYHAPCRSSRLPFAPDFNLWSASPCEPQRFFRQSGRTGRYLQHGLKAAKARRK